MLTILQDNPSIVHDMIHREYDTQIDATSGLKESIFGKH